MEAATVFINFLSCMDHSAHTLTEHGSTACIELRAWRMHCLINWYRTNARIFHASFDYTFMFLLIRFLFLFSDIFSAWAFCLPKTFDLFNVYWREWTVKLRGQRLWYGFHAITNGSIHDRKLIKVIIRAATRDMQQPARNLLIDF